MRCPYCGSTRISVDPRAGLLVCMDCGSVIAENLIEEPGRRYFKESVRPLKRRSPLFQINRTRIPRLELPRSSPDPIESLPMSLRGRIEKILAQLEQIRELRYRRKNTKVGVALYILERVEGSPKTAAIRVASRKASVSESLLAELIHRYRSQILDIELRVVEECVKKSMQQTLPV
jgi:transcription initiation factor TFIIIB Brf1 subunit/transcription initiation factor TFIIB